MKQDDLEELWASAEAPTATYHPELVEDLPVAARRYFGHAIAPGTPMASAVRLRMHGTIRLKDSWDPFEAEQVLRAHRGFVWRATIRMKGVPVKGFDRWVDGEGEVKWKLLGLIPVAHETGPEVSRSAVGRAQIEGVWLPSAFLAESVSWEGLDDTHTASRVRLGDEESRIELATESDGRLREARMLRWGTPDGIGTEPRQEPFGCIIEEERTFDGYTVPSKVRVGWHIGTDRWEEGEFFRGTIDEATYR
jgi:hypothetical protein